ncbi:hypothetical protein [Nesterenkonia pannonica]|nr:hypothetical protein [Nesterenkonia pannonica]
MTTSSDTEVEQPAGNASRADWVEYALYVGATEEELEGMTRDEIRDTYGD